MKELLFICEWASTVLSLCISFLLLGTPPPCCLEGAGRALWLKGMKEPTWSLPNRPLEAGGTASRLWCKTLPGQGSVYQLPFPRLSGPSLGRRSPLLTLSGRFGSSCEGGGFFLVEGSHPKPQVPLLGAPLSWPCSVSLPDRPSPLRRPSVAPRAEHILW